jgi:hypothetical protein
VPEERIEKENLLDLRVALANYFERIMTERREPIGAAASKLFRDLAEKFERTPEFSNLLHSLRTLERTPALKNKITGQDRIVLEAHFRRSGLYLDLFAGKSCSIDKEAAELKALFLQTHSQITYLAPVDLLEITEDCLPFGRFKLQRFSESELLEFTRNHILEVFYPWAALDLRTLSDYWFLIVTESVEIKPMLDLTEFFDPKVKVAYSALPLAVEHALYPLVLCDWIDPYNSVSGVRPVAREAGDEPWFPHVPFVIRIPTHPSDSLSPAPQFGSLAREPYFDNEGNELGDRPAVPFHYGESETEKLKIRLQKTAAYLESIRSHDPTWRFVGTALGFLTKAFRSEGIEQLLWHITAIEAILGQDKEGLTSLLKRRVAEVFGGPENEKKQFRSRFDKLYKFRSNLVHGNAELSDKGVMKGHLAEARDFARGVVSWAIGFLGHWAMTPSLKKETIPSRDDLLLLLDMTSATRQTVAAALGNLPTDFPACRDWLD